MAQAIAQPGQTTSDALHGEELEILRRVLSPLGKERADQLIELATRYLEEVSPITWCAAQGETGEASDALVWQMGQPSPLDPTRIIFCMFYSPEDRTVTAYGFSALPMDGREGAIALYTRESIIRPRYMSGPIALQALYNDLIYHLTPMEAPRTEEGGAER